MIDMQNDFISGTFKNKDAQEIVPKVAKFIKDFDGYIYYTMDEHLEESKGTWAESIETNTLPKHCIQGTEGYELPLDIKKTLWDKIITPEKIRKFTFGSSELINKIKFNLNKIEELYIIGLCTDICVITNTLMLRTYFPNLKITVISDLCAGTTPENHTKALDIMKMNLINTKISKEI